MMLKRITFVSLIVIVLSALFIAGCGGRSSMQMEDIEPSTSSDGIPEVRDGSDIEPAIVADSETAASVAAVDAAQAEGKSASAGDFYFPVGYPVEKMIDGIYYKLEMLENGQGLYRFKMSMRNDLPFVRIIEFKNRERFDVSMSLAGQLKWRANLGKHFGEGPFNIDFPQFEVLAPGQSRVYSIDWNGRGNNGEILPNGMYMVQGTITSKLPYRPTLSADRWYSLGGWGG